MMDNLVENIRASVKTGLIDSSFDSEEELRPKLIYNDTHKGNTVLSDIEKELRQCIATRKCLPVVIHFRECPGGC